MIKECPVNMECKFHSMIDLGTHDLFIGEIVETYIDKDCVIDDKANIKNLDPIITFWKGDYWKLGDFFAKHMKLEKI